MSISLRRLRVAAAAYFIPAAAGTMIALRENLPAAFAGKYSGKDARGDFLTGSGTALTPPLGALLLHALWLRLAGRGDRWGTLGVAGLLLNGVAFTIGMFGEPITYTVYRPRTLDPLKALVVTGNIISPILILVFGAQELARRTRRH